MFLYKPINVTCDFEFTCEAHVNTSLSQDDSRVMAPNSCVSNLNLTCESHVKASHEKILHVYVVLG